MKYLIKHILDELLVPTWMIEYLVAERAGDSTLAIVALGCSVEGHGGQRELECICLNRILFSLTKGQKLNTKVGLHTTTHLPTHHFQMTYESELWGLT